MKNPIKSLMGKNPLHEDEKKTIFDSLNAFKQDGYIINDKIIETTFSKELEELLMTTDLNHDRLEWVAANITYDTILIDRYVYDENIREKYESMFKRIIMSFISIDRKGRTELFDSIKTQISLMGMEKLKEKNVR